MHIPRAMAALALAGAMMAAGIAPAQDTTNRVATETDWSAFAEGSPQECWAVSAPKETVNTRDGQVVAVNRGDILLFVTYRQGNSPGEVSFTGGYPFAEGSNAELVIGDDSFSLFTEGEWAWSANAEEDARIIAAMRAGVDAVITARSTRGTTTRDTFSLLGFTAMSQAAADACAG
ncbi:MAG: hypothetical protein H5U20_04015 [Rhodobacteraceae bacterium]|nr:hypothetical protein [Paracoccaceae bacterium]